MISFRKNDAYIRSLSKININLNLFYGRICLRYFFINCVKCLSTFGHFLNIFKRNANYSIQQINFKPVFGIFVSRRKIKPIQIRIKFIFIIVQDFSLCATFSQAPCAKENMFLTVLCSVTSRALKNTKGTNQTKLQNRVL